MNAVSYSSMSVQELRVVRADLDRAILKRVSTEVAAILLPLPPKQRANILLDIGRSVHRQGIAEINAEYSRLRLALRPKGGTSEKAAADSSRQRTSSRSR